LRSLPIQTILCKKHCTGVVRKRSEENVKQFRPVEKEREEVLQILEQRFPCSPWRRPWWYSLSIRSPWRPPWTVKAEERLRDYHLLEYCSYRKRTDR